MMPPAVPGIRVVPTAIPALEFDAPNCDWIYLTIKGPSPVAMMVQQDSASVLNTYVGFFSKLIVAGNMSLSFP